MYGNIFIDGQEIKQIDQTGKQILVGYSLASYNKLLDIAEQYKAKLEDAGLIEKVLTPEEQQAKQTEILERMMNRIEDIGKRVSSLEKSEVVENV